MIYHITIFAHIFIIKNMLHQNQAKIESPRQKNNESKEIDAMLPTMKFYL